VRLRRGTEKAMTGSKTLLDVAFHLVPNVRSGEIYVIGLCDRMWPTAAAEGLSSQALVIVTAYSSTNDRTAGLGARPDGAGPRPRGVAPR
jgi:hypothetical protein